MNQGIIAFLAGVTGDPTIQQNFVKDPTGVMKTYGLSESAQATILAAGRAGQPTPALMAPIGGLVVAELTANYQSTW